MHSFGDDALPMHGLYLLASTDPIAFHSGIRVTLQQIGNDDIGLSKDRMTLFQLPTGTRTHLTVIRKLSRKESYAFPDKLNIIKILDIIGKSGL